MTTLLIEMPSGIAGDMLLAGLLELGGDVQRLERDLLALGVGQLRLTVTRVQVSGIGALRVDVAADQEATWLTGSAHAHDHAHAEYGHHLHDHGGGLHDHHGAGPLAPPDTGDALPLVRLTAAAGPYVPHRPYSRIRDLLDRAPLPTVVRARAQRVFRVLAEAEGAVHGVAPEEVEFHEVGALDAIADVVGCCLLLEQLGVTRVLATPIQPGRGTVRCAHGLMPVPVPAVAAMLAQTGAPHLVIGRDTGELTTPTGCALVTALADGWVTADTRLAVRTLRLGYGAGHRTVPGLANVVRVSLVAELAGDAAAPTGPDTIAELRCALDDATGEQLAILLDELLAAGARDAWLAPLLMKKGRPGHELTVLCDVDAVARFADLVLTRSPGIGLRWQIVARRVLPRHAVTIDVDGHAIPLKVVTLPGGGTRAKPEADAVRAAATALDRSFADVQEQALRAWRELP
ncbi:MAG: LarC family nickel insertion protein [Planctomycetes bacterium]|nr:LarC family nickel insertion protein [Planctomycetota bacterium]